MSLILAENPTGSAVPANKRDETEKQPYTPPVLSYLGQITAVTLGSGGSCLDGNTYNKKVTGSNTCPQDTTTTAIITSEGAAASSWGFSADN